MTKFIKYSYFGISAVLLFISCKKNNLVVDKDVVAPAYAKFNTVQNSDTVGTYYVKSTNEVYKLPVGVTNVSNTDRTIQFTYTGAAVQGTQFTAPASIVIKAGETLDSLTIAGIFAGYPTTDRVDTLKIAISGGDVAPSAYKSVYRLILRKACDVVLEDYYGDYNNTYDNAGTANEYGPYSSAIVAGSVVSTGPTSAKIQVSNIWDYGGNDITVELDWSDPSPANYTTSIPDQKYKTSEGLWIKGTAVKGSFSSCDKTFILNYTLYEKATGAIFYANQVTTVAP